MYSHILFYFRKYAHYGQSALSSRALNMSHLLSFLPRCMQGESWRSHFRPSVFVSVSQTRELWWKKLLSKFLYRIKVHSYSFLNGWWPVGDDPFYPSYKNADFQSISARSVSAVTPIAKNVQLWLTGSPLRARFPMSLRWTAFGCL